MFKLLTAAQTTPAARTPQTGGREKQKTKFGSNYITNDLPNGERTKRDTQTQPTIAQRMDMKSNLTITVETA